VAVRLAYEQFSQFSQSGLLSAYCRGATHHDAGSIRSEDNVATLGAG
jgi:hypothetical protein